MRIKMENDVLQQLYLKLPKGIWPEWIIPCRNEFHGYGRQYVTNSGKSKRTGLGISLMNNQDVLDIVTTKVERWYSQTPIADMHGPPDSRVYTWGSDIEFTSLIDAIEHKMKII